MIGIIDYGIGNIASVSNALHYLGHKADLVSDPEKIFEYERLVLPGVGSFRAGMQAMQSTGHAEAIKDYVESGKPLLGICLGMQLLFERGEEHGFSDGLGLIPGEVVKLSPAAPLKLPHVGWNSLIDVKPHPLMSGVKPNIDVYFVHSYHCVPQESQHIIASCDFGGLFVSAVANKNVSGMQFHPEKSQPIGMRILDNFADWDWNC
jgi:glutamine amidotransferase